MSNWSCPGWVILLTRFFINHTLLKSVLQESSFPLNKQLLEETHSAVTQKEKNASSNSQGSTRNSPAAETSEPPLQLEPAASPRQGRQATQGRTQEELLGTLQLWAPARRELSHIKQKLHMSKSFPTGGNRKSELSGA